VPVGTLETAEVGALRATYAGYEERHVGKLRRRLLGLRRRGRNGHGKKRHRHRQMPTVRRHVRFSLYFRQSNGLIVAFMACEAQSISRARKFSRRKSTVSVQPRRFTRSVPYRLLYPMIATLSLANGLTLLFAALCLWTMALQSRGGVTTLGRVALPGGFALLATLMLLAGVFETSILFDILWVVAFAVGSMIGRTRGWMLSVQSNREAGLVSLPATVDGLAAALILAALSGIDFTSAMLGEALIEPGYIAAASALCAGFLGSRMLVIALRVVRPTPPGNVSRTA
jgi:hypothetical protein